jgi:hypothetical protein
VRVSRIRLLPRVSAPIRAGSPVLATAPSHARRKPAGAPLRGAPPKYLPATAETECMALARDGSSIWREAAVAVRRRPASMGGPPQAGDRWPVAGGYGFALRRTTAPYLSRANACRTCTEYHLPFPVGVRMRRLLSSFAMAWCDVTPAAHSPAIMGATSDALASARLLRATIEATRAFAVGPTPGFAPRVMVRVRSASSWHLGLHSLQGVGHAGDQDGSITQTARPGPIITPSANCTPNNRRAAI